jgi:ATP-binding cassette subfamily B protein
MVKKGGKSRFFGGIMFPMTGLVQKSIYVFIAIIGSVNVVSGTILIGDMQVFLQYSSQFTFPI